MFKQDATVEVPEILSASYGPPDNANEWVKYTIALTGSTFDVSDEVFVAAMRRIGLIRIRTEMRDGNDEGSVDEIRMGDLYSGFDGGTDGWSIMGDGTLSWMATDGYNGGYISIMDWASGDWHWAVAPPSWSGDLSSYIGQNFEFYFKTNYPSYAAVVEFHTTTASRLVLSADSYVFRSGGQVTATIAAYPKPTENTVVSLSSSDGDVLVDQEVVIPANAESTSFVISALEIQTSKEVVITASAAGYSTSRMTLNVNNGTFIPEAANERFHLYPNPAVDVLNIVIANGNETVNWVRLIDNTGRLYLFDTNESGEIRTVDVSELKPGLYIVEIQTGKQMYRQSFIKK